MKKCPRCGSYTIIKGRCAGCRFEDRRKVHTMLNPQVDKRGRAYNPLDHVVITREKRR